MSLLVLITMVLLLVTKWMDATTTSKAIRSPHQETNPFARNLMHKLGISRAINFVVLLAFLIILLTGGFALVGDLSFQVGYVLIGIPIAFIQFSVARYNSTGEETFVVHLVQKAHSFLKGKP